MGFDLPQSHIAAYGAAALLAGYTLVKAFSKPDLSGIPAIGPSGMFSSYLGAYRYISDAKAMILEGASKYRLFRIPLVDRWNVIIVGAELVDQLRWAKEDELSSLEGFNDVFQGNITLGPNILGNPYHLSVTRVSMPKNIGTQFDEVHDEIRATFEEQLNIKGDEWVTIPVKTTIQHAICRTTNRLFVGLPLCRNQDYLDTNFEFATSVVIAAQLLNIMPAFMRPIVGPFVAPLPRYLRRSEAHLTKLVAERVHLEEELERGNNYPGRANDLISWLLDVAEGEERTVPFLVQRVLNINLAAIHTSSTAFGNALIDLAVFPDSVDEMREEAENIILERGWSKDSVAKMHKIDSFLRESQRFTGNNITFMVRKVVKDGGFTFADGTTVPKGCFVEVATGPMHFDPEVYPNPHTFDALRFYRMRLAEENVNGAEKHESIATSLEYLVWGHGRHACPGRFIAVTLLKTMIAHVLLNYDVKMEDPNAGRPESQWFASTCSPSPTATVMFRKRKSRAS